LFAAVHWAVTSRVKHSLVDSRQISRPPTPFTHIGETGASVSCPWSEPPPPPPPPPLCSYFCDRAAIISLGRLLRPVRICDFPRLERRTLDARGDNVFPHADFVVGDDEFGHSIAHLYAAE